MFVYYLCVRPVTGPILSGIPPAFLAVVAQKYCPGVNVNYFQIFFFAADRYKYLSNE